MILPSTHPEITTKGGGKAAALAQLEEIAHQAGATIPRWFVVPADSEPSSDKLRTASESLGSTAFAVRSSAKEEDGHQHSFAGQFDTFLHVAASDLSDRIQRVHDSNQSERVATYSDQQPVNQPSAIVQAMITADISGVAFSADPISGRRAHTIVNALWGAGTAVVSGECASDQWIVDRSQKIVARTIVDKIAHHQPAPESREGVREVSTDEHLRNIPCLTNPQIVAIATLARACESHFNCPQDIEWAIAGDQLYLLQSRPITTIERLPDPDDPATVWDNSNIAESYSGITSPLTFSFAERAYEHVYREFCDLLSVPKSRIARHDSVFPQMLGHIHGHVYYNLNSWYEVLALLPGFSMNRPFMEQMMGVKRPLPEEIVDAIVSRTRVSHWRDILHLVKTVGGLVRARFTLTRSIKRFQARLNDALTEPSPRLAECSLTQLRAHYLNLETQLLRKWDAPLINDFFAMIASGLLRSLCAKWLGNADLHNQFLADTGDIISLEPSKRITQMARLARTSQTLAKTLADPEIDPQAKLTVLHESSELATEFEQYLQDFGDRCLEELKLESATLADNPAPLLTSIGIMASTPERPAAPPNVIEQPKLPWLKRLIFTRVSNSARTLIRQRENLRFERTRLFGRVRRIFVQIGKRLHGSAVIDDPNDIFFLTLTEALDPEFNQHRTVINQRKHQQASFDTPPPDRFITHGPIERYRTFTSDLETPGELHDTLSTDTFRGIGACHGIVSGKVRVVTNPREATMQRGEILVAKQTDPGWIVLFPAAAGLIVERGSLLSHSAIVSRELNLPCIVSVTNITTTLRTGDHVEMNGTTGLIRRVSPQP